VILISACKKTSKKICITPRAVRRKSVWQKIFDIFTEHCKVADIRTFRSLTQIKEKWQTSERYKAIVGNSKKTSHSKDSLTYMYLAQQNLLKELK